MKDTWWRDFDELIIEQADILDIATDQSFLIKGPPGSGKTNLLLLRANQLFLGERPNLHVVVFGSLLKNFIQLGGAQYRFPQEKIVTHAQLFNQILQEEGEGFDSRHMGLIEAREERANRLYKLLVSGKVVEKFDALLLDEAQDYTPEEVRIFRMLTDVLIATGDSRQKVYNVDDCADTIENCTDSTYTLKYHFRNGIEICKLADGICKRGADHIPLVGHSQYDELSYRSKVTFKQGLDLEEQAQSILEQINDQRFAYPDDLIAVLCPTNDCLDVIQEFLINNGLSGLITRANSNNEFDPKMPIWMSTITAAKGLEFRAVHIAGLDKLAKMGPPQRRLIFTGVTRAKTALSLYWKTSIPGYLASAIRSLEPVSKPVSKQNIFGNS